MSNRTYEQLTKDEKSKVLDWISCNDEFRYEDAPKLSPALIADILMEADEND